MNYNIKNNNTIITISRIIFAFITDINNNK